MVHYDVNDTVEADFESLFEEMHEIANTHHLECFPETVKLMKEDVAKDEDINEPLTKRLRSKLGSLVLQSNAMKKMKNRDCSLFEKLIVQRNRTDLIQEVDNAEANIKILYPGISRDLFNQLSIQGFQFDSFSHEENENCCDCKCCDGKFKKGGWIYALACALTTASKNGPLVRAHVLKALETMESKLDSNYCEISFDICMVAKLVLETAVASHTGFSGSAARLQRVCVGIVRSELGRRFIQKKSLPPVIANQESTTRKLFRSLATKIHTLKHHSVGRKVVGDVVDEFLEEYNNGNIDPISWDEIVGGGTQIGNTGSGLHIYGAWGMFEGRCDLPEVIEESYFSYLNHLER